MLTLDNLHVALDAESGIVRAIDALSLSIERGETFALVGESGCGKSMTALALMRLLPENGAVTAGDIGLDGRNGGAGTDARGEGRIELLDLPEAAMRRVRGGRIGMIFQEPSTSLNPVMRVGDQIVEAIETHTPLRGDAARAKAIDWLRRAGIPEPERRIDDYPFRMSGGQKQRVMIAMTLAAEPDFIVADEPTTALDVTIQAQILDLLRDLQRERGIGLLLITHDLAVVSGMAHRVALMYAGQIIEVASAEEFFKAPLHPYAGLLLAALPDSRRRGEPLAAIAGTVPPLTQRFDGCRFAPRCPQVMPVCSAEVPQLRPCGLPASAPAGHLVRCWLHHASAGTSLPAAAVLPAEQVLSTSSMPILVRAADRLVSSPSPRGQGTLAGPASTDIGVQARDSARLLDVDRLNVRFPQRSGFLQRVTGHFHAVKDVSLSVGHGQTLALVGESGCGKTTLGKAVVQLLRGIADIDGRALLDGTDLFSLQGDALRSARRQVQIVFQDPFASLNPRLRVAEILDEGAAALDTGSDAATRQRRILDLCDQVGLRRDSLGRYPHEFSGGQRQRIAIARALAVKPQLIVCDEPTSALDVSVQAQILNLLSELQRTTAVSYLFITHNIGVVEYLADHIAVMRAGRLEESGPANEVLDHPQSAYTRQLLDAVPRVR